MKNTTDSTPSVRVKKKYALLVSEYCIENNLEFNVTPKLANKDEFDVTFNIEDINAAISLGIFLRENRIEFGNYTSTTTTKKKTKKATKTESTETTVTPSANGFTADSEEATNAFPVSEDSLALDIEQTTN